MARKPPLRLLALVCAVELVDLSLISAISPLLPRYAERFDFGAGTSGRIVAAFAIGNLLMAVPAAMACGRVGAKRVAIVGLLGVAGGSVWLGVADSTVQLAAARFVQGLASSTAWGAAIAWLAHETPPERRGRTLGISGAFAIIGTLVGPGLGALAAAHGIALVFVAVSVAALVLAAWSALLPGASASRQTIGSLVRAVRAPQIIFGFWLIFTAGSFLAAQGAIGPLRLDVLGWGASGIGVIYMLGAGIEATMSPAIGHWIDRGRRIVPIAVALGLSTAAAAGLAIPALERHWPYAVLIGLSSTFFGLLFLPGLTSLADGAETLRLDHAYGFSLATLAWAPGQIVGSLIGGAVADVAGDPAAYGVFAALTMATLVALPRIAPRARA